MSDGRVYVVRVDVSTHPNADALDVAQVGGYQAIIRKGSMQSGDLGAYIPEASMLPAALVEEMGLTGRLAGPEHNRVKAVKLRGLLSQGLVYPATPGWSVGDDVTDELGVVKWEPPIPTNMAGEVFHLGADHTLAYDVENWQRVVDPATSQKALDLLRFGEDVVITEKIHGTFLQVITHADGYHVASKGLGAKGLAFKPEQPRPNLYQRAAARLAPGLDRLRPLFAPRPLVVCGEVFGKGVQDLTYGRDAGRDETIGVRVFDVWIGTRHNGRFLDSDVLDIVCRVAGWERVPVLYRGPFSELVMAEHTTGRSTLADHIREGVVVRPIEDRHVPPLGRVQVKSVSPAYLTRGGDVTEYV